MKNFLAGFKYSLEKIDYYRDQLFFLFIKPHWPRQISPNQITYSRILIGALLFILLFFFNIENKFIIISLFAFGGFTDLLDGSVARGLNKETEFGAMIDPAADRILVLPIAVYSLFNNERWLLLVIILIELINGLVLIFYKSKETLIKANIFGKVRMDIMVVVLIVVLIEWPIPPQLFFVDLLWASLIFSFLSILTRILELNNLGHIKNKTISTQLNKYEKQIHL